MSLTLYRTRSGRLHTEKGRIGHEQERKTQDLDQERGGKWQEISDAGGVRSIGTGSLAAVRPTIHIAPWALSVDAIRRLIWNSGP